ncbi:MAG: tRNA 2-thiouridine(34) synthase MnmA [Spirochaetes bacterium]|nr:tRNA 2-thiouridine(34) synthase MnmA [Spirochaetota bacterium]
MKCIQKDPDRTVLLGMSGGVDSAVAALLLQENGFSVLGMTMKYLPDGKGGSHYDDAATVSRLLGIPHAAVNVTAEFEEKVIENFRTEYLHGRTPNPCVLCNRLMKFDLLLEKMKETGAGRISTGHYARVVQEHASDRMLLQKGKDQKKDQSYFLYMLTQGILKRTLFPLGDLTKKEVRKIAKTHGLPVSVKDESQEICFIEGKNYRPLLKGESKPGPIVDCNGNNLGTHTGIADYTLGQRRGLGIPAGRPLYVVRIIPETNTIVVGEQKDAYHDELVCEKVNWIASPPPMPASVHAKVRSLHPGARALLLPYGSGGIRLLFEEPQWAITPGQSAVFYSAEDGKTVLGGGIIESAGKHG